MEAIKKGLKDIEDMIPYRFNFDFGEKEYTGSTTSASQPVYEISDMLGKKIIRWRISPTLELIIRYRHVLFQDGRTYIVGKTEITDIISLFEYLQTTRNYAIFNNLLNVMLIFIIDHVLDILKSDGRTSTKLIDNYINEHYRKLYRVIDDRVILLNSFIYGIEKEVFYPDVKYDWDTCFYTLLENLRKRRQRRQTITQQELTSSSSPEKDVKILLNNLKKHIDELEYNMAIGHKLILSLQYQFIIDNIHEYASTIDESQSMHPSTMKVIYETDKKFTMDGVILKKAINTELSDFILSNDVINDEIREELKSWMSPKYRFIREATDSEKTAAYKAYELYVRENERRRHTGRQSVSKDEEEAYCKYAEAVSINSIMIHSRLFTTTILLRTNYKLPVSFNYNQFMLKFSNEKEAIEREHALATEHDSIRTKLSDIDHQNKITPQFGGIDPGSLLVLGSMVRMYYKLYKIKEQARVNHPLYKGSNRVYVYRTLSTISTDISKKLLNKKHSIFYSDKKIYIHYSYKYKKLYLSYNQKFPDTYNRVVIVSGNSRITENILKIAKDRITQEIKFYILDRFILFKNKHILKELYTNIKKYIDGRHVKVSPHPKSSSSSSFGSIGSPPKS